MAFYRNKILYVPDSEQPSNYLPFNTVSNQIFLTADTVDGFSSYDKLINAILYPKIIKVVQVYLLNEDESVYKDISEYIVSGNMTFQYQQGVTRNGSLTLYNEDNIFLPDPIRGIIWNGKKLKINCGIYYNGTVFWRKCGVFCIKNPKIDLSKNTVSFEIYDKFALFDGTVGGKRDNVFKISVGTNVESAVKLCLEEYNYNGKHYDMNRLFYPDTLKDVKTPYTINKTGGTMGDIILELAKIISCNTAYNDIGCLELSPDFDLIDKNKMPIVWDFNQLLSTCTTPSLEYDYTDIPNVVRVVGAIENGKQYKGEFINTNPLSKNNISISEPNVLYIEDSNIIGDELCQQRAEYEWRAASRANLKLSFQTVFNPFLSPNSVFLWSDNSLKIKNEKFIINSISFDLFSSGTMDISASNLNEVTQL